MPKYQFIWSDRKPAVDPRIVTRDGQNVYEFEVESMDDAEALVRSFKMVAEGEHDFSNGVIKEVEE